MAEHSRSGGSHSHRSDPASSNHPRGLLASFAAPARPRSRGEDLHHTLTFGTLVVLTFKIIRLRVIPPCNHTCLPAGFTRENEAVLAMEEIRVPSMEDLHRWRGRQGPKLRALLAAQENQHPPVR